MQREMKRTMASHTGMTPEDKRKAGLDAGVEAVQSPLSSLVTSGNLDKIEGVRDGVNLEDMDNLSTTSSMRRAIERDFSFERDKNEGPWREVIVVDILSINEMDYKGTIRPREAIETIFLQHLI